jgi:hypothetical protein
MAVTADIKQTANRKLLKKGRGLAKCRSAAAESEDDVFLIKRIEYTKFRFALVIK